MKPHQDYNKHVLTLSPGNPGGPTPPTIPYSGNKF